MLNGWAADIWAHCCGGDLPLKAACLSKPYADPQHIWKGTRMFLICGISISYGDSASERGAGVKTGAERY